MTPSNYELRKACGIAALRAQAVVTQERHYELVIILSLQIT
ncbi:hypothetical protein [Halotia branconii]|uniref:Uncharacterized protein n=1 Tax=Halotia branconii CENA392 TaxID=1539056 RepID=A0AAJ6NUS5_9CYAN|nr:hypothetical protein [Halotia branconii]WGV26886.1 hypothetical protein QI031_05130 [Halotia branconii CENA392]